METGRLMGLLGACFLSSDVLENHYQGYYYWNQHGRRAEETKKKALIVSGKEILGLQIMPQDQEYSSVVQHLDSSCETISLIASTTPTTPTTTKPPNLRIIICSQISHLNCDHFYIGEVSTCLRNMNHLLLYCLEHKVP